MAKRPTLGHGPRRETVDKIALALTYIQECCELGTLPDIHVTQKHYNISHAAFSGLDVVKYNGFKGMTPASIRHLAAQFALRAYTARINSNHKEAEESPQPRRSGMSIKDKMNTDVEVPEMRQDAKLDLSSDEAKLLRQIFGLLCDIKKALTTRA